MNETQTAVYKYYHLSPITDTCRSKDREYRFGSLAGVSLYTKLVKKVRKKGEGRSGGAAQARRVLSVPMGERVYASQAPPPTCFSKFPLSTPTYARILPTIFNPLSSSFIYPFIIITCFFYSISINIPILFLFLNLHLAICTYFLSQIFILVFQKITTNGISF